MSCILSVLQPCSCSTTVWRSTCGRGVSPSRPRARLRPGAAGTTRGGAPCRRRCSTAKVGGSCIAGVTLKWEVAGCWRAEKQCDDFSQRWTPDAHRRPTSSTRGQSLSPSLMCSPAGRRARGPTHRYEHHAVMWSPILSHRNEARCCVVLRGWRAGRFAASQRRFYWQLQSGRPLLETSAAAIFLWLLSC